MAWFINLIKQHLHLLLRRYIIHLQFNRIPIEVLSVVATQVKTIQDAIAYLAIPSNRAAETTTATSTSSHATG